MPKAPMVRRALLNDVDTLVALRREIFLAMGMDADGEAWQDTAREWFAAHVDSESCGFFLVEAHGRVVACGVGMIRDAIPMPGMEDARDILISNVCTFPDERGRGYGNLAFEAVMEWARSTGVRRLELMATPAGQRIYERYGFTINAAPAMRMVLP